MEFACNHEHFMASVDVHRLTKGDNGPVTGYAADIHIHCAVCGQVFVFVCPDVGMLPDRPAVSVDGAELRAPIAPSDRPDMRAEGGFRVSPSMGLATKASA